MEDKYTLNAGIIRERLLPSGITLMILIWRSARDVQYVWMSTSLQILSFSRTIGHHENCHWCGRFKHFDVAEVTKESPNTTCTGHSFPDDDSREIGGINVMTIRIRNTLVTRVLRVTNRARCHDQRVCCQHESDHHYCKPRECQLSSEWDDT
jgi:hypothetical protein